MSPVLEAEAEALEPFGWRLVQPLQGDRLLMEHPAIGQRILRLVRGKPRFKWVRRAPVA